MNIVKDIIARNRSGKAVTLPSVCSAQPDVLKASLLVAHEQNAQMLIEATSNQVNQFGGYTGMTPKDFIAYVRKLAGGIGINLDQIVFGGDHLGPQVWRNTKAEEAMSHAQDLMRCYVEAGFTKIHLDCSEGCAGEPAQVDDETSATRAAELAAVCEKYAPNPNALSYVIGTEVPPPGGARAEEAGQSITPTNPEHARHSLACHMAAFEAKGLAAAWDRVIGLVVQPGLEFAPTHVDHFDMAQPDRLSAALSGTPHIAFEAHSTDYQNDNVFPELARRHFAVLKVGPALTFAYRQALYALDHLSARLNSTRDGQGLSKVMEQLMQDQPGYWQNHYLGTETELRLQRHFGYADRIRYYWPEPAALAAVDDLFAAIKAPVAAPLVAQYFAPDVIRRAETLEVTAGGWARALVWAEIQTALAPYFIGET
ncbi:class II D-tagatose-bisphosphate aldolase, non-catalytic subunit [Parasedimentitalea psychrophila]|uniref:Class II D-tagatose-bisphosphate aldolase, non-catalytic subunit n=1 Tax=Parasedimentitalea psychrophila TaxID=2997337 RepID=A0A9Y2L186_9RHOB|nr:class II D-tagatose-bisphosphate aldolase, non-catalytic subunit [Parasedimentitalea psychrophila]WIY25806.1 class II D-tagatose-bisphosphate aldolase, non-catalytic subunit [Parasedimentitalea psychrophila]